MSDKPIPRPPQVMLCGGAIVAGSVLLVLLAFDQMAALGSIEAQEAAADFVSRPPGEGLGISADQVQTMLRALCVVVGGTAVATAALGWQAMQRRRSARFALSVLAVVLVVAGTPAGGGIAGVSAVVAVGVALLWAQPARDWYAGITPQRVERPPSRPTPAPTTSSSPNPTPPPPTHGASAYPPPPPGAPGSTMTDTRTPSAHGLPLRRPPASVLRAVRMTIVASSVVAVAALYALLVALNDRGSLETEIGDQLAGQEMYDGVDVSTVVNLVIVGIGFFVLWALAAIVLAVLTLRGNDVARIALVVSSFGAAGASVLGIALVLPLLIGVVGIAVAVLLLRPESGEWFAERRRRSGPPS